MNGDVETRLARLEGQSYDFAKLEQRVSDLDMRVTALVPVTATVIQQTERLEQARTDIREVREELVKIDEKIDEREESRDQEKREEARDRRYTRWTLATLTVMILCALIGAGVVLLQVH